MTTLALYSPQQVIGTKGLKNLGRRVSEEYLNLLKDWSKAAKIYIEMMDTPVVSTMLSAIKLPLLAADFDVERAGETLQDQMAAQFLWDNMQKMHRQTWRSHVVDQLSSLEFGFSVGEIVMERRDDGRMWLKNIDPRGQETLWGWDFDKQDTLLAFIQQDPDTGTLYTIPSEKLVHSTFNGRKGNPQGKALLREVFRAWRFLGNLEDLEGIGIERNVGGMPVATLPEEPITASDETALRTTLRNLRMDEEMFLILPFGATVTPYSGGTSVTEIGEVITRKKQEILMRGFAQFLMLGMDNVGTQALVQGSQDFFVLALKGVQQQLLETWNQQLVPFLFKYNPMPGLTDLPRVTWNDPGKVDIQALLTAYKLGTDTKAITPVLEDEQFLRPIMGLPDLPEGEGMDNRTEQPMALAGLGQMVPGGASTEFANPKVSQFHLLGQHDQLTHGSGGGSGGTQSKGSRPSSKKLSPSVTPIKGKDFGQERESAKAWAEKTYDSKWHESIGAEEKQALVRYGRADFLEINDSLRGVDDNPQPRTVKQIEQIDRVMSQSVVPEQVIVYRALSGAVLDKAEGKILTDKGFVSTSLNSDVAERLAAGGRVVMRVEVPKGVHAIYMEDITTIDEQEMLLKRGSSFAIGERYARNGHTYVNARVIE